MGKQVYLENETVTEKLGLQLAKMLATGEVVFLHGDLGVGKTTLTRGIIKGMGFEGRVKSPTYTLVEPYELDSGRVAHFDLYRLAHPEELEYIGLDQYLDKQCICLFEWPERGKGILPAADLEIWLEYSAEGRLVTLDASKPRLHEELEHLSEFPEKG